jgi:hypothetical protein
MKMDWRNGRIVNNAHSPSLGFSPHAVRGKLIVSQAMLFIIPFLLLLTGCDFRRIVVNQPIDARTLEILNPGKSSIHEVVQVLGAPDDISAKPDGMVFRYRYGDSKTMRVNFGWILRFFLPVAPSMNLGRGQDVPQVLQVAINRDGTFEQYVFQPPPPSQFSFWPF